MLPIVQFPDVLPNISTTNTSMALHTHVVTNGQHNLRQSVKTAMKSYILLCTMASSILPSVFVRLAL